MMNSVNKTKPPKEGAFSSENGRNYKYKQELLKLKQDTISLIEN